ncbi:MAG: TolC family outer membrane protein [gamma proteobacterium symbiont of Taylorina sp.]|nr:TolC family outer membrane protein [gamma proteobacterium symbiont of Taylorina sp.]
MKKIIILLTILLSLTVFQLSAQAANLIEVYNSAVRSDPVSIAAQLQVLISEESQQQSEANLFPQASLDASLSDNRLRGNDIADQDYTGNAIKLNIRQVLFDMQAWRDNEKFELLIDKSSDEYHQAQSDLMVKVVERYFEVLQAKDAMELAQENTVTMKKNLEQLSALYKKQLVPVTGVYEIEARLDLAYSIEIEATAALSVAFERLYEVIGERIEKVSPLKEDLQFSAPTDDIKKWLDLAMENNHFLAANRSNVLAAKKDLQVRQAGFAPRFNLNFIQSHQDTGYDNSPRPETDTSTLMLSYSQPIYQGGGISSRKREGIHRVSLAEQGEIESLRRVEQQLREHYLNLKSDVLKIKANRHLIESEKKRSESMRAGFKFGTVTVSDVLDADTDFLKAQLEYQKAKYNYIKNQVRLKSVAGVITEQDIIELNSWVE